jgi:hypothetical protein
MSNVLMENHGVVVKGLIQVNVIPEAWGNLFPISLDPIPLVKIKKAGQL